jgi:hypothetical protein
MRCRTSPSRAGSTANNVRSCTSAPPRVEPMWCGARGHGGSWSQCPHKRHRDRAAGRPHVGTRLHAYNRVISESSAHEMLLTQTGRVVHVREGKQTIQTEIAHRPTDVSHHWPAKPRVGEVGRSRSCLPRKRGTPAGNSKCPRRHRSRSRRSAPPCSGGSARKRIAARPRLERYGVSVLTSSAAGRTCVTRPTFMLA